jgi:PKD domain
MRALRTGLPLVLLLALAAPAAAAPRPALFEVGAAVESINPTTDPVYSGGFGLSDPITKVHDPLEVRALYVSNGKHAVAIAVVDAQAWFAAYQDKPDYGITDVREQAAAAISKAGGPKMTPADVIVQATHTHAGPTLEGIWGPVPARYLKRVHDQAIKALTDAAATAVPAHLRIGTYDAPWLDNIDTQQTDSYPGWAQDGQVSVLRAVAPDGGSVASFVSVPAHGDIVCGSCDKELSADYFGFVRAALDERLGGVNVVGPATLGREETPVQVGGIGSSEWFAGVVDSIVGQAMAHGHWITNDTVASANRFLQVPAHNAALLALNAAWKLPEDQRQAETGVSGIYPIARSMDPPYLVGNVLGADLTALRIGNAVFLSMPGEPFPEIRAALQNATTGADTIVALSKGQDDWGYFYPAWTWGFTSLYPSDHNTYNVAPQAGDQVILGQADNMRALGFAVDPAVGAPLPTRWEQALRPGVQAMASPTWGTAGARTATLPVTFTAIYDPAFVGGSGLADEVHVDFGDGTGADVTGDKRTRFTHDYAPGDYTARLSGADQSGNVATWQLVVRVYPPLRPLIVAKPLGGGLWRFSGRARGGDGYRLAWRWRFADGASADGRVVEHRFAPGGTPGATLTVADGTTMTATANR